MSQRTPHWHVLGAGAIGCLFGAALAKSGSPTTMILREVGDREFVDIKVQRNERLDQLQLPVFAAPAGAQIDHLLITTKAYDVPGAIQAVKPFLSANCTVLLLVNGMGLSEQLRAELPAAKICCGTTTQGAYRIGPQHIQYGGEGETRIGCVGQTKAEPWFTHWASAIENCQWDSDIEAALWAKLAINCIINPLTALHDCHNGELARSVQLAEQVKLLCAEVASISAAAGFADTAANLVQASAAVIAATADNRSSMLQDLQQGLPTEINYITGYLLKVAAAHGVPAPLNKALFDSVNQCVTEANNRAR